MSCNARPPMDTGIDLVDRFKLNTTFHSEFTEHWHHFSDPTRGVRKETLFTQWSRVKDIGQGAFGTVYLERAGCGSLRAVKELRKHRHRSKTIDYLRELLAMAYFSMAEATFVRFDGWFEDDKKIYIAMEYLEYGDLEQCVSTALREPEARAIVAQVTEALEFMHRKSFTHRDLKPSNVFVVKKSPNWWVKLADFGFSKRVRDDHSALHTSLIGDFVAPEVFHLLDDDDDEETESTYTSAVDMWSLGCLTYWLVAGMKPFPGRKGLKSYCKGKTAFPSHALRARELSNSGLVFIQKLMAVSPQDRLVAQGARQDPWLLEFKDLMAVPDSDTSGDSQWASKGESRHRALEATTFGQWPDSSPEPPIEQSYLPQLPLESESSKQALDVSKVIVRESPSPVHSHEHSKKSPANSALNKTALASAAFDSLESVQKAQSFFANLTLDHDRPIKSSDSSHYATVPGAPAIASTRLKSAVQEGSMSCESGGGSGNLPKDVTTTATKVETDGESRENHTIADNPDSDNEFVEFRYNDGHAGSKSYPSRDAEKQHQGFRLTPQNAEQTEQASSKRTTQYAIPITYKPQQVFIESGARLAAQRNGEEEAFYLMDRRWNKVKESRTRENTRYTGPQEPRTANAQTQDQAGYEMQKSTSHQPGRRVSFASSAALGRPARDEEFSAMVPKFTQFWKSPPEGMFGTEYAKLSEIALPQEFNPHTRQAFNYSLESPPVNLKVKVHNDGRHITLRRLTEEEALADREARQRENQISSGQRRRDSSISRSSDDEYLGGGGADKRWRRNKASESAQANTAANAIGPPVINPAAGPSTAYSPQLGPNQGFDPQTGQAFNLPPPPPIPRTSSAFSGPTDSDASDYANSRRRRRSERAQARLAREIRGGRGNMVDFT